MLIRQGAAVSILLAAALVLPTGCAGTADPPAAETVPSGMRRYEAPPPRVPHVRVGTTVLTPAQYAWRIDGQYRQSTPKSDDSVSSTAVPSPKNGRLAFTVMTSVRPTQAKIIYYPNTAGPVPKGEGVFTDCETGTDCSMTQTADHITLLLDRPVEAPSLVVLDLQYPTLEEADRTDGIASYGASWVVRLEAP